MTDRRRTSQPTTTEDLSASTLSTPHCPRHPPKHSDIRRYRRCLSDSFYTSLRHYETIVQVDSRTGQQLHRVLALSEDRIHILKHKEFKARASAPFMLKEITRIERVDSKARNIFASEKLNRRTQHIKITHVDPDIGFIELFTWEDESKLYWHLEKAYYSFVARYTQNIPVSVAMQADRNEVKRLFEDIEEEICSTEVHGNPLDAQECAELLYEVQEALMHDRHVKEMFFDSGRMFRFIVKNLNLLQANDNQLDRKGQLRLVVAMLSVLHAALFNSETLDKRLNILVPRPYTFMGVIESVSLDYRKSAAIKSSRELQRQLKDRNLRKLQRDAEERLREERNRPLDENHVVSQTIRQSLRSTGGNLAGLLSSIRSSGATTASPPGSPTRQHMSQEDYYDDHSHFRTLVHSFRPGQGGEEHGANVPVAVNQDTGHAHTQMRGRVHRSNSMAHIWSHGPRRASAVGVPPTWSRAKSEGLDVRLDVTRGGTRRVSQVQSPVSFQLDMDGNRIATSETLGNAMMMTGSKWEHAKTRVAESEARLFSAEYAHEEQALQSSDEENDFRARQVDLEFGHESDSDSDLDLEDERDEGVQEHNDLIRQIEMLQILILNEFKGTVEHGVHHKSGHVYESFGETLLNIPGFTKKRLPAYVNRFVELIRRRDQDGYRMTTFSWLVKQNIDLLHMVALSSYRFREALRRNCMEEIKFFFCSKSFVQNLDPTFLFNSISLKTLDEALVWILHADESAGDKEKIKEKQKHGQMEWSSDELFKENGSDLFKDGPLVNVGKRGDNRKQRFFQIYYKGERIVGDDESHADDDEYGVDSELIKGLDLSEAEEEVENTPPKRRVERERKQTSSDEGTDNEEERDRRRRKRRKEKKQRAREEKKMKRKGTKRERGDRRDRSKFF